MTGTKLVADGQLFIGSTTAPYTNVGTLASGDGSVTITNGAGTIDLSVPASGGVTVTKYTSSGTFTKAASTKWIKVIGWGGGGGGGSGRKGAAGSNRFGGGGGSSGPIFFVECDPIFFNPAGETVTIGAGGTGGASQTTNSTGGNQWYQWWRHKL
jgi:hypothetical protein